METVHKELCKRPLCTPLDVYTNKRYFHDYGLSGAMYYQLMRMYHYSNTGNGLISVASLDNQQMSVMFINTTAIRVS